MSDLHRTPTIPTARKPHRCIACGCMIPVGEKYTHQDGFYGGGAYRNRYHNECFKLIADSGDWEFSTGNIDRPERLTEGARP